MKDYEFKSLKEIYSNARKSKYGKETSILFEPPHPLNKEDIIVGEVDSTFHPSKELEEKVKAGWDPAVRGPDGTKWGYEGHFFDLKRHKLYLGLGHRKYSEHFVLRNIKGLSLEDYPAPFTINTLQSAYPNIHRQGEERELLIAVRNFGKGKGGSDQKGLAAFGSGFDDRLVNNQSGKTLFPSNPFLWCLREMLHEAEYATAEFPFYFEDTRFLGLVRGSNTDIAAIYYQPLAVSSDKVHLNPANFAPNGKPEHCDLWTLLENSQRLQQFLEEGGMNGVEAPDHLLGGVELLVKYKFSEYKNKLSR